MHSIKIITYGSNRHPVILGFSEKSEMNEGEGGTRNGGRVEEVGRG